MSRGGIDTHPAGIVGGVGSGKRCVLSTFQSRKRCFRLPGVERWRPIALLILTSTDCPEEAA